DAAIAQAIGPIFKARFNNAGQICAALKRLFVHRRVFDDVVVQLKAYAEQQKIGDPMRDDVFFGPLVSEKQKQLIKDQLADAV
ncbi:aldehyde dehydrogenase family protein, partial [Parvimonas micra]|uniref:aldehyde dehydrogenase family protein n=1 Tax=Parvimonas micra TaxID=33033 RepID=UPI002B46464C